MKNNISTRVPCLLSIPEVAWVLGVDNSRVCRAIRLGVVPVVRRRGRVLVSGHVLARLAAGGLQGGAGSAEPPAGVCGRGGA